MRRFMVLMSFATGVLLSLTAVLCAQTIQEPELDQIKTGDEALKAGYLLVSGLGVGGERPHRGQKEVMALRAAQILAYRELLESVQGMTISSETTVQNAMADEKVRVAVEGVVRGAQTISKHYDPALSTWSSLSQELGGRDMLAVLIRRSFRWLFLRPPRMLPISGQVHR